MFDSGKLRSRWSQAGRASAAALFPMVCLGCRSPLASIPGRDFPTVIPGFCPDCDEKLPRLNNGCAQCARPLASEQTGLICGDCQRRPPDFDDTRCHRPYQDNFVSWIKAYKYQRQLPVGAALIRDFITQEPHDFLPDILIPVPLHPQRQRQRGFNQSAIFAQQLGSAWQIPVRTDIAHRTLNTPPLYDLKADARRKLMRKAFTVSGKLSGRTVGLVDDILTSGATAHALAGQLKAAGAEAITVYVLSRTI